MDKYNATQKNKIVLNYVYAVLVAMMVIACAITIALVSAGNSVYDVEIGGDDVLVSAPSYVLPLRDATVVKDYSATELQYNDTLKQWEIHKAIDLVAGDSKEVLAVADGTVINVYNNYLEGAVIEISHANGLVSVYKSLNQDMSVSVGDSVSAGQVIATISDTMAQESNSGSHLHFEMLKDGVKVNPHNYLNFSEK